MASKPWMRECGRDQPFIGSSEAVMSVVQILQRDAAAGRPSHLLRTNRCASAEVQLMIASELCHLPQKPRKNTHDLGRQADAHRCCVKSLIGTAMVGIWCASARADGIDFQACSFNVRTSAPAPPRPPSHSASAGVTVAPNSEGELGTERNGSESRCTSIAAVNTAAGTDRRALIDLSKSGRWLTRATCRH
jgi:hypothetical protein